MSNRIVMRTGEALVAGGPPGTARERRDEIREPPRRGRLSCFRYSCRILFGRRRDFANLEFAHTRITGT